MNISCYCSFWFPLVKGKGDEMWFISDIKRDLLCWSKDAQHLWAAAAGWLVSLCDLQQTLCTAVKNVCCPFQDTVSNVVDEQTVLILPWIWPSSKKRNDIYHKSQVLISHALAFHAALRVSPHCSSIILKWMSGKGCHVVNLGRLFSFQRYIILMPTYCSNPYLFKATSQTSLWCLAQSKQHLWYHNSEFLLVGRPGGWEAAVDGEIPWLGNQNPCP